MFSTNILTSYPFDPEYSGKKKGDFFHVPIKCFGKDCTQLYKIYGFRNEKGKWYVMAQRIHKRTGKMPKGAALLEGFEFNKIFSSPSL